MKQGIFFATSTAEDSKVQLVRDISQWAASIEVSIGFCGGYRQIAIYGPIPRSHVLRPTEKNN
jgi:hypothetical protein